MGRRRQGAIRHSAGMRRPSDPLPTLPSNVPTTFLTCSDLARVGLSRRDIHAHVADGALARVRRGRYLPAATHPDVVQAARLGGRVDCLSLLALWDVFVQEAAHLHIQVTNGASRLPPPPVGVVRHWRESAAGREDLLADVIEALAQACRCQPPRAAIATLDSAWHRGLVDEEGIAAVFALLPRRYRRLRALLDPRCESGCETLVRLMLRSLGCDVDLQVEIDSVGFVDFLVDGWLIVECDSEKHHGTWRDHKRDRRRDVAAAELGYATIRLLAEDILFHPESVMAALRAVLSHAKRGRVQNSSKTAGRPHADPHSRAARAGFEEFCTDQPGKPSAMRAMSSSRSSTDKNAAAAAFSWNASRSSSE